LTGNLFHAGASDELVAFRRATIQKTFETLMTAMLKFFALLSTCVLVSTAVHANNCEPLREQIEANIASKGVTDFTVTVVDAEAVVVGDTVGSCGQGTKKIVYARGADATGPSAVRPQHPTPDEEIWVECKDGSMVKGGGCKS
jgi:hypothetical protein